MPHVYDFCQITRNNKNKNNLNQVNATAKYMFWKQRNIIYLELMYTKTGVQLSNCISKYFENIESTLYITYNNNNNKTIIKLIFFSL